jgi:hypothetical protein
MPEIPDIALKSVFNATGEHAKPYRALKDLYILTSSNDSHVNLMRTHGGHDV